ncbi:uncharacterized protein LOC126653496 [Mercurialis annua]|uniref:uncharacterized protein LOC126653496 n=1 Tax=Mercurialis annua TaxID=3986 RepID=UPI00215F9F62|nr:uncharacterized protein LOC126653496 [Mercurialis annua]
MTETDLVLQAKLLYNELEKKSFALDHYWEILQFGIKWQDLCSNKKKTSTVKTVNNFEDSSSLFDDLESPMSQDLNDSPVQIDITEPTIERPIGRKAEKESRKRSRMADTFSSRLCDLMCDFNKQTIEAQQRKALVEERKLRVLEEANDRERKKAELELKIMMEKHESEQQEKDDKIMMMNTSNMDDPTRAYYKRRKAEILAKTIHSPSFEPEFYIPLPPSPSQS